MDTDEHGLREAGREDSDAQWARIHLQNNAIRVSVFSHRCLIRVPSVAVLQSSLENRGKYFPVGAREFLAEQMGDGGRDVAVIDHVQPGPAFDAAP